tara:strand:- start:92 stop:475 length:384 start_codon:yes stop_codon:yes gene_type:complete
MENRLKAGKELKEHREGLVKKQKGICGVSGIKMTAPVLDHCHESGLCRMALQREINAFEGKVFNAWKRYVRHLGVPFDEVLAGLVKYHQSDFTDQPLHPTHRTDDEKRLLRNKRARRSRKKAKKRAK